MRRCSTVDFSDLSVDAAPAKLFQSELCFCVLLKVSGEALLGDQQFGIDDKVIGRIAGEIRDAVKKALPKDAPKAGSFKAPEKLTAGGEG